MPQVGPGFLELWGPCWCGVSGGVRALSWRDFRPLPCPLHRCFPVRFLKEAHSPRNFDRPPYWHCLWTSGGWSNFLGEWASHSGGSSHGSPLFSQVYMPRLYQTRYNLIRDYLLTFTLCLLFGCIKINVKVWFQCRRLKWHTLELVRATQPPQK